MVRRSFFQSFVILTSGTVLAQAIPLVMSPILSRTYNPKDFGLYATFTTIVGILSTIYTLKYDLPILNAGNKDSVKRIVDFCIVSIFSLFLFSSILSFILYLFWDFSESYLLIPICSLFIAGILVFDRIFNKNESYRWMSTQRLVKNAIEAICNLAMFFKLTSFFSLIMSFVIGSSGAFLLSLLKNKSVFSGLFSRLKIQKLKEVYQEYSNFRLYTLPHTLLSQISENVFVFLIPLLYSHELLGFLVFGLRLFQTPLGFISASLFSIFSQQFTSESNDEFKVKLQKIFKLMCIGSLLILPFSYFLSDIFTSIFGISWQLSGKILTLLTPWILLSTIVSTFAFVPLYSNMQKKAFYMEILNALTKIIPFVLAYFFNMEFWTTLVIFAGLATSYMIIASIWIYSLIKIK